MAVGKAEHGDFRAGKEFFDDHALAAPAEASVCHHFRDGSFRFLAGVCDHDALAEGKAVRLDDRGDRCGLQIGQRVRKAVKGLVLCRRDAVTLHQILCKDLAAFDHGSALIRSKAGDPGCFQCVHGTGGQRVVRRDDGVVDLLLRGEPDDTGQIKRLDRNADRIRRHSGVAGQHEDLCNLRVFL